MNYGFWKNPGGKKILCLSGFMIRSNQFSECALTSLVVTSIINKHWIYNMTPEGEALWHCPDLIPIWSTIEQAPPPLPRLLPLLPPKPHYHFHWNIHKVGVRWASNRRWNCYACNNACFKPMRALQGLGIHRSWCECKCTRCKIYLVRYASCNTPEN